MSRERHGAKRAVRHREALQHREILERAEPVAQPLRLRDPELSELRPQRLDQLHLVAVRHHDGAQLVQRVGLGLAPVLRRLLAQAFVCSGKLAREVGECQLLQLPRGDDLAGRIEGGPQPLPVRLVDRAGLRGKADRIEPAADRRNRARRQFPFALDEIGEGVDRRLGIARTGEFAREVARLPAQPPRVIAEKGVQQPQQRAPALQRLAQIVNRDGVGRFLVIENGPRLGQDIARDGPESLADRNIRTNGGFLGHVRLL